MGIHGGYPLWLSIMDIQYGYPLMNVHNGYPLWISINEHPVSILLWVISIRFRFSQKSKSISIPMFEHRIESIESETALHCETILAPFWDHSGIILVPF